LPPLRKIEFEIATNLSGRIRRFEDELHSVTIRYGNETFRIDSGDEAEKLLKLAMVFHEIDPDIILTEDGDSFIFPYLARRASINGILDNLILGREEVPLRIYELQGHSYFSYGKILFRQTAARLFGRLHIDRSNAFIGTDCGLEGLFEVARTCIIPVQRASRTTIGTSMTSLQLYHATKQDVLIPWNKNDAEDWKSGKELLIADRGGLIYEPQFGIHDSVGELDFSSLYPTIMMKKNLSGETVKCGCCPNSTNRVPELSWNVCEKWEGIVPRSLRILLRKRMFYKKLKKETTDPNIRLRYDQRQAALKWILVCSFGYLGFKNARFGKIDAHIATCAYSREILRKAATFAESKGFKLVHGIVDSIWLKKVNATNREYEDLACEITEKLNFPVSFEGRYKWIVFLNSRMDRHVAVLNRYYGVAEDGKMKLRGIDLRRHDTPRLVNECQNQMLRVFSKARNSEEFRKLIPEAFAVLKFYATKLKQRDVAIEDLAISKNLSKNPEDYEKIIPQAVAAKHLTREGHEVQAGQPVCYVLTRRKARALNNRALPLELANTDEYDAAEYVGLLHLSAMNLLLPLGYGLK
jgi:DNA polymerase-2